METFKTVFFIVVIMLGFPVSILLFDDWLKRRKANRELREAQQIVLPKPYRIEFVSTSKDLTDAHRAFMSLSAGLRPGLRVFFLSLGLLWAAGPIWVFVVGSAKADMTSLLLWLGGCAIVWGHLVRPIWERIQIQRNSPARQAVTLEFNDPGIIIHAEHGDDMLRSWNEIEAAIPTKKGLLISFTDGVTHWLPKRVFSRRGEMLALAGLIHEHVVTHGA